MPLPSLVEVLPPGTAYHRSELEPRLNALGPWQEAVDQFVLPDDQEDLWSGLAYPTKIMALQIPRAHLEFVRELLRPNAACLEALDRGLRRGALQFAEFHSLDQIQADTEFVSRLSDVARLHILRFRIAFAEEDLVSAAEALFCLEKIGSMICNGDGQMIHYMVGLWLQAMAVRGFGQLAARIATPRSILERIVAVLDEGLKAPDGFAQSLRVDLCTITLAQLDRTVEGPNLEAIVDKVLEIYFVPQLYRPAMASGIEPGTMSSWSAGADRWLEERRRQVLLLLAEHPKPLDKAATARLMGAAVAETIRELNRARRPAFLEVVGQLHGVRRKFRLQRLAQKTRFWRAKLIPSPQTDTPRNSEGRLPGHQVPMVGGESTPADVFAEYPLEDRLTALKARLQRVDNPLGLMLFERFLAHDYIPNLLDHLQMTRKMRRLIKQRLAAEGKISDEV